LPNFTDSTGLPETIGSQTVTTAENAGLPAIRPSRTRTGAKIGRKCMSWLTNGGCCREAICDINPPSPFPGLSHLTTGKRIDFAGTTAGVPLQASVN